MPYKDPEVRRRKNREYHKRWLARQENYGEMRKQFPSYAKVYSKRKNATATAHERVHRAIKAGKLVRPTVCPQCGAERFIEAAHLNYTGWMDIIWLCRPCHRRFDAANPKGGNEKP